MNDTGTGTATPATRDWAALAADIATWGRDLGFQAIGISDTELSADEGHLLRWLAAGRHGRWTTWRGTARRARVRRNWCPAPFASISARMNYWSRRRRRGHRCSPTNTPPTSRATRWAATITRCCARRLQQLADRIQDEVGDFGYRVFTDSAPVLEVALAAKSGLGWRGKHTLLLTRDMGSYFFLGEIYTNLPLPRDGSACQAIAEPAPRASTPVPPAPSSRHTNSMRGAASPI